MTQEILILDRKSGRLVSADFHDDITSDQLMEAESQWKPGRNAALQRLLDAGKTKREAHGIVQHLHWDWTEKARALLGNLLTIRCFGIVSAGRWQGLVMVDLAAHRAQLEPDGGKPLVYVEFLETAPWNLKDLTEEPRFGLVGVRLMEAVIRLSLAEGFRGRVALLALPQAEKFYEQRCGMTRVEGAGRYGMAWYELTRKAAASFLEGGQ